MAHAGAGLTPPLNPPRQGALGHPEALANAPVPLAVGAAGHGVRADASAQISRTAPVLAYGPLSLLGRLFGTVPVVLDDPFVVYARSIAEQFLWIKTGNGEELPTSPPDLHQVADAHVGRKKKQGGG